ncbi:hypothetical protein OAK51_05560 [Alphaproteobacteria bacterium]|nr:hypothetical protein [Alphaproteobacteria bacterium]
MKEDYKVDPSSIKFDQTKQDTRRDAWDRDYMGSHYKKPKQKNADMDVTPVYVFAIFFIAILVMIG